LSAHIGARTIPKSHPLSRWLHHRPTDLVIVTNTHLRGCYLELLDLPEDMVRIVPAGLDFADFASLSPGAQGALEYKAEYPTVGLLARFSPVKGHDFFFQAARVVAEKIPNVRFLLAGFESELNTEDLREMARQAGVDGQTEIIDRRTGSPAPIIARFDVGVVSSVYSESVSRSLMENLAAGVPVVATDVGGVPDLLAEGDFGILIPPKDAAQLATGIIELLQDHDRRRQLGFAGREFIFAQRTWEQAVENFAAALFSVVKANRKDSQNQESSP